MGQGRGLLPGIRALQGQSQEATARAQGLRPRCVHPQALPLRSHHFQKVGKKPELMLVWEPETLEQEPVQQVRTGLGPLSRSTTASPANAASPPPASRATLCMPSPSPGRSGPRVGRHQLTHTAPYGPFWHQLPSPGDSHCGGWLGALPVSLKLGS